MRKTIFAGAAGVALSFGAADAYAGGMGWTPPWASPYAILEPQTVPPWATANQPGSAGGAGLIPPEEHAVFGGDNNGAPHRWAGHRARNHGRAGPIMPQH